MTSDANRQALLRERARTLPARPGVYLLQGAEGEVLYVGKAKSLRARVRSYLRRDPSRSPKLAELARRIRDVETFVLESEAEALLLEWNLIREHRPRFNVQLRDDKSYPYVKVTVQEPFPRVLVTRQLREDGARYFGPFTDVGAMRRALRTIKRIYPVRSCHYDMPREMPERPCLDWHIGRCRAPCAGHQSREEYAAMIDQVLAVLSGRTDEVRADVERRMRRAADRLDFERAADLRDVLRGLDAIERRQAAVDYRGGDRDVVGIAVDDGLACGTVLKIRSGRLLGREVHYLTNAEREATGALAEAFVKAFYLRAEDPPPEVLVPADFPDRALIEEYLSAWRGGRFRLRVPARGAARRLMELAEENAGHVLRLELLRTAGAKAGEGEAAASARPAASGADAAGDAPAGGAGGPSGAPSREPAPQGPPPPARRLAEALGLETPPRSLLCFDASTLGGTSSVGSAVWLEDGRPRKEEYRRFRLRAAEMGRPDDYAAMQEIVGRWFQRRVGEGGPLPDLVVVDGGRGQLSAARQGLEAAGASDIPVVALAKREEELWLPGRAEPVRLARTDPALHWLQRARDEAHRFALRYNQALRRRRTLRSRLADVPGVGPRREQELLRRFGSLRAVRAASAEALQAVPGIGPTTARRIRQALRADVAVGSAEEG